MKVKASLRSPWRPVHVSKVLSPRRPLLCCFLVGFVLIFQEKAPWEASEEKGFWLRPTPSSANSRGSAWRGLLPRVACSTRSAPLGPGQRGSGSLGSTVAWAGRALRFNDTNTVRQKEVEAGEDGASFTPGRAQWEAPRMQGAASRSLRAGRSGPRWDGPRGCSIPEPQSWPRSSGWTLSPSPSLPGPEAGSQCL